MNQFATAHNPIDQFTLHFELLAWGIRTSNITFKDQRATRRCRSQSSIQNPSPRTLLSTYEHIVAPRRTQSQCCHSYVGPERWFSGCTQEYEADGGQIQQEIPLSLCIPERGTLHGQIQTVHTALDNILLWLTFYCRRTSELTNSETQYGLIPHDNWYQPGWINETRATAAREDMIKNQVIYGGTWHAHV